MTLADADSSGATSIATSGSDNAGTGQLLSSNDVATLSYSGLARTGASITGSLGGSVIDKAVFTPVLNPIAPASLAGGGPLNAFNTPSLITFTASEIGWTNAPYNQTLTSVYSGACSYIAAVTPVSGTTFTALLISSLGTGGSGCTLTLSDGGQKRRDSAGLSTLRLHGCSAEFYRPRRHHAVDHHRVRRPGPFAGYRKGRRLGRGRHRNDPHPHATREPGVYVGGQSTDQLGGFNDGGPGHADTGDGGGGASDVRAGSKVLNRLVGGGGGGGASNVAGGFGGAGDGGTATGIVGTVVNGVGGQPGSANAGGAGGVSGLSNAAYNGLPGVFAIAVAAVDRHQASAAPAAAVARDTTVAEAMPRASQTAAGAAARASRSPAQPRHG